MKVCEVTKKEIFLTEKEQDTLNAAGQILNNIYLKLDWEMSEQLAKLMFTHPAAEENDIIQENFELESATSSISTIADFILCLADCLKVEEENE